MPSDLITHLQGTHQALTMMMMITMIILPLTFWLLDTLEYPNENINWIFPLLHHLPWSQIQRKKKKVVQEYLMAKSDSTKAEVEERNLIASLLTHMFSIDSWFSSIFIITISGSIPLLQDGYPICGYPFPVRFLPPAHLLATLTLLHVTIDTAGGHSRFWKENEIKTCHGCFVLN